MNRPFPPLREGVTPGCSCCLGTGYVDAQPPEHCSCLTGVLAKAMDDDPLDDRKANVWHLASRVEREIR